jgi:hypothetical protein
MRLTVAALLFPTVVLATLKAHALFSDHVVLQTTDDGGPGTAISGTGIAGEIVSLSATSDASSESPAFQGTATVGPDGNWVMPVNMTSGGPFTLKLTASKSKEALTARDALVGDVYICSGQSNMVFPIGAGNDYRGASGSQSIENATAELKAGNHPDMRLWFVPSPAQGYIKIDADSARGQQKHIQANNYQVYVGASDTPQTNLTGGCNTSSMCTDLFDKKKGDWYTPTLIHSYTHTLLHSYTPALLHF